jgi:hypothetical protein
MGKFSQVEFDSLAPYEQKQYEMDNPRSRVPRGEGADAQHKRFMANVSGEDTTKIEKNLEAHRAKMGSDTGGKTIRGGGGSSGTGGAAELKSLLLPRAMKKGGKVKSASARADGCAIRGKTRA